MRPYIVALLYFFIPVLVLADDHCVRALPEPIIHAGHSLIIDYQLQGIGSRSIIERAQLSSGRQVRISQSGCAHFGLSYQFLLMEEESDKEKISLAIELLTELQDAVPLFTRTLIAKLSAVPKDHPVSEQIVFEPGYDGLSLSFKPDSGRAYFVIDYDVAL